MNPNDTQIESIDLKADKVKSEIRLKPDDERHHFRISPDAITLNEEEVATIVEIAALLPGFVDGMHRLKRLALVDDKLRRNTRVYKLIRKTLGLDAEYTEILSRPERNKEERKNIEVDVLAATAALDSKYESDFLFGRFDLVISESGELLIVEIEEGKNHGFGYATLVRSFSENPLGNGIAQSITELSLGEPIGIVLSDFERFYELEMEYLSRKIAELGGNLVVIPQRELEISDNGEILHNGMVIPRILKIPSFGGNKKRAEEISNLLRRSPKVTVLSPTQEYLSNKGAMALIRNEFQDEDLENILIRCFGYDNLAKLRLLIPPTFFPFDNNEIEQIVDMILGGEKFFIKIVNSSGARGVFPPGDNELQIKALGSNKGRVIVQKAIDTRQYDIKYLDLLTAEVGEAMHSIRIGVFSINGKLSDVAVTASQGHIAHGGRESVQMGAKLLK